MPGSNNGQIASQEDLISGEKVAYQYDSLKRLGSASATVNNSATWGQGFTYDGFGNFDGEVGVEWESAGGELSGGCGDESVGGWGV